jgi:peptide/nickel transport system substrate-binding protein
MAINRDELIQGVLLGLGVPAKGPYKPGAWYDNENIKPVNYDPEGAKKLLAEAGYTWKGTQAYQPDGKPFTFTVMTNQGNDSRRKTAEIIQRRLGELGIIIEPRIVEWSAIINDFVDKKKFDAVILGWTGDIDPDQYSIWHSSQTDPKQYNFVSFNSPEVDKLLVEGRETFEQSERKKIYDRFQEVLHEEQPYAFLYVPKTLVLINNKVHGIEPAAAGIGWNFEKWWIPKPLQTATQN